MGISRDPLADVLLILTNREDFSADYLITRLRELDLPYYRLDADVLHASAVSCELGPNAPERRIAHGGRALDLRAVRSVWYRRCLRPTRLSRIAPMFRGFAATELRHLFEGMLADDSIQWVNPIAATEAAERKLLQLRLAPEVGLSIPPTLVSNDLEELTSFAKREGAVICKPISQGLITTDTGPVAVHTEVVTIEDLRRDGAVAGFPTLLQRRARKGHDIRVTVIGSRVFPVEIDCPADAPVDWRAAAERVAYRPCTIPKRVEAGCRALLERLQLKYGAFDFVRTADDDWVFLEVNPAGEWAWLEVELELPMREAFIDLFYEDQ